MKKLILSALLFGAVSLGVMAQDDVYFTPSKSVKKSMSSYEVINDSPAPLSGSNRDVDEYNRRGKSSSYFKKIGTDSLGNDIIEFHTSAEDITDTLAVYSGTKVEFSVEDDYKYSRRLSRFDDYYWCDPWLYGYYGFGPYWRYRYTGFWYDPGLAIMAAGTILGTMATMAFTIPGTMAIMAGATPITVGDTLTMVPHGMFQAAYVIIPVTG